jgi:3,4-dihydroxy 2-butanone 4-phosphate synthase/GTP cyclohydrolase II
MTAEDRALATIPEAIKDLKAGRMIILVDDEGRENEGDLLCLASFVTPEIVNFMATHGRGLICMPMSAEIADHLKLTLQVENNTSRRSTAFTVSIEARTGVTTGISAADRARTIQVAADPGSTSADLVRPGHVFPLRAMAGGVLRRAGHTEGAVDLARLAEERPAAVVCEIMNSDGSMARMPDLLKMADEHGLLVVTVADLITYRRRNEKLVDHVVSVDLPTQEGLFRCHLYQSTEDQSEHVALSMGELGPARPEGLERPVLVRVHSECLTGDVLGSLRCDCGQQLNAALSQVAAAGEGVVLYMRAQEGRGIGLANKLKAYHLQQTEGLDTVEANEALGFPADIRDYGVGAQILRDLGVRQLRLLTNNPSKYHAMRGYGLQIAERVALEMTPGKHNLEYLRTKRDKMGHALQLATDLGTSTQPESRQPPTGSPSQEEPGEADRRPESGEA